MPWKLCNKKSMADNSAEFDEFARDYESLFKPWLKIAGGSREFFARERLRFLSSLLHERKVTPKRVIDFGCGTGMSLPLLNDILGAEEVIGLDTSEASLGVAREGMRNRSVQLATPREYAPQGDVDLVFCNGVFHHIPVVERLEVMEYVYRCLRPRGLFAFWENNPWNPVQLLAMKLAKLDKNAIPLSSTEACRLLESAKFQVIQTDYLFFFPAWLKAAHPVEQRLTKAPLGAQYQVLSMKTS